MQFSDDNIQYILPPTPSVADEDVSLDVVEPVRRTWLQALEHQAKTLKAEVLALNYALKDPRTPWYAKLLAVLVLAYALSPLDLIPDFIPVIGFLDDVILLPLGLWASIKLIPAEVMEDARFRAMNEPVWLTKNWTTATLIFLLWLTLLVGIVYWACDHFGPPIVKNYCWVIVSGVAVAACCVYSAWAVARTRQERAKQERMQASLLQNSE